MSKQIKICKFIMQKKIKERHHLLLVCEWPVDGLGPSQGYSDVVVVAAGVAVVELAVGPVAAPAAPVVRPVVLLAAEPVAVLAAVLVAVLAVELVVVLVVIRVELVAVDSEKLFL